MFLLAHLPIDLVPLQDDFFHFASQTFRALRGRGNSTFHEALPCKIIGDKMVLCLTVLVSCCVCVAVSPSLSSSPAPLKQGLAGISVRQLH